MVIKTIAKELMIVRKIQYYLTKIEVALLGEDKWVKKIYEKEMGKRLNLESPVTLNEKIVWLKVHYLEPFFMECCDKYLIHDYLKRKLGKDYAPRLLYFTQNPSEISLDRINHFPCIIKVSNGSGANLIVWNRSEYTDEYLRKYFKKQVLMSNIHTIVSREHQYVDKNPYIVAEELLQDENGGIPNDYKFMYIDGELQFVYCSVDRLGINVRQIYDQDWNRLHFIWVKGADKALFDKYEGSAPICKPKHYEEMLILSKKLAKDFKLVRIDFYETNDRVYIGEITLHHGSGSDRFYPDKYDLFYGERLVLPNANR